MKNVGHFLCAAASALGILAFVACDKQQDGVPPVSDFVLYASIEQPVSAAAPAALFGEAVDGSVAQRTVIQEGTVPHPIVWKANDQIVIHFDTGVQGAMRVFNLQSGVGTGQAEFVYSGFGIRATPMCRCPWSCLIPILR